NPYSLRDERALSSNDVRNRVVTSSLFDLPIGEEENGPVQQRPSGLTEKLFGHIEAAPIFTFSSGRPVNALTGTDEERSRAFPVASRPLGFRRNSLETPRFVNLDLRMVKFIPYGERKRLDFTAEAFNAFNHPNIISINPFYGSGNSPLPTFGMVTGFSSPRQI